MIKIDPSFFNANFFGGVYLEEESTKKIESIIECSLVKIL